MLLNSIQSSLRYRKKKKGKKLRTCQSPPFKQVTLKLIPNLISSLQLFYGEGHNFCFSFSSLEEIKQLENWDCAITF